MVIQHISSPNLEALELEKADSFILCDCGQFKSLFALICRGQESKGRQAIRKFQIYTEEKN